MESQTSREVTCMRWREMKIERGPNLREEEVPLETARRVSSVGCRGQKKVVTLAHHYAFR